MYESEYAPPSLSTVDGDIFTNSVRQTCRGQAMSQPHPTQPMMWPQQPPP